MKKISSRFLAVLLVVALVFVTSQIAYLTIANASAITPGTASDVVSTLTQNTLASHTVSFTTSITGGVPLSTGTIILAYSESPSTTTALSGGSFIAADLGFKIGSTLETSGVGCSASGTANTWNFCFTSFPTVTIYAPTGGTAVGASTAVTIYMGTSAGGSAANHIMNATSAGTTTLSITAGSDVGTVQIPILTQSYVNVTATVSPTITFTISQTSVCFGTLSIVAATYATSSVPCGTTSAPTTTTSGAHYLSIATNSPGGYDITVQGATLTIPTTSNTIAAIGSTASDVTTHTGNAQFGIQLGLDAGYATGSNAAVSPYNGTGGMYAYNASATTAVTIATNTGPTSEARFNVNYAANISGVTPAGTYSTSLTYVATGKY